MLSVVQSARYLRRVNTLGQVAVDLVNVAGKPLIAEPS